MWRSRLRREIDQLRGIKGALVATLGALFRLLTNKQRQIALEILKSEPPPESLTTRGEKFFHRQMTEILTALGDEK